MGVLKETERPLLDIFERAELEEVPNYKMKNKRKASPAKSKFPGSNIDIELDEERLTGLQLAIFNLMKDGQWRTHSEMKSLIGRGSENGIAAMLRNLRSPKRGRHTVNKRRRGHPKSGLYEYQLIPNPRSKKP